MDDTFAGFVDLEATLYDFVITRNGSLVPSAVTGNVTFNVYNETCDTVLLSGTTTTTLETGAYAYSVAATSANGFEAGKTYPVVISYVISATTYTVKHRFTVT